MWFAWKFVPLWYQQQPSTFRSYHSPCCDLLENSYLCGISNNFQSVYWCPFVVVICLKIRTFVVSATTLLNYQRKWHQLWFAWKFVPLWYQQQHTTLSPNLYTCCDLLENSYLCGISNNIFYTLYIVQLLWFAWKFVPLWYQQQPRAPRGWPPPCCDLLENSYLCGISNNLTWLQPCATFVVICLKIRTFVVSATTQLL